MTPAETTAHHEAGHALCYWHFGDRIRSIELFGAGHGIMRGLYQVSRTTPFRDALRSLCGPAAEFAVSGSISRAHCRTDLARAERCARHAGLRLEQVWPMAQRLVARYQDDIAIVAEALLRRGQLNGGAVERLIGGPCGTPCRPAIRSSDI